MYNIIQILYNLFIHIKKMEKVFVAMETVGANTTLTGKAFVNENEGMRVLVEKLQRKGIYPEATLKGGKWTVSYQDRFEPYEHIITLEPVKMM